MSSSPNSHLYVAVSVFEVANERDDAVAEAFIRRPQLVENAPGFVSLEVLRNHQNPRLFWLITRWTDDTSYRTWHRGHTYKSAHRGIPRGLKLVPGTARVHEFAQVCL